MHKSSYAGVNLNEIRLDIEDELLSIQSSDGIFIENQLDLNDVHLDVRELEDKVQSQISKSGFNEKQFLSGDSNSNPFSMIRSPGISITTQFQQKMRTDVN